MIEDIKIGQLWLCVNNDLVRIIGHYNDKYDDKYINSEPNVWQFTVSIIESEHRQIVDEDIYDVTGEGKFWEGDMGNDDLDVGHNLSKLLSIEENPEYFL